jgi:rare lipoprotein A
MSMPLRFFMPWVVAGLLCCFLSGCGGGYRTRVIETSENTVLRPHEKPYTVNNALYRPLLGNAHGFVQEGLASWYGPDFHGKKTSNGEIYDMYAMTAAHKTLPLGIWVRVINRSNGRTAVVRVNDRGPFVRGRVIDLSYAAADRLGVIGPGTAPVRVEALGDRVRGEDGRATYQPLASYDVGSYAVQVGAFSVGDNARRLAGRLQSRYGSVRVRQYLVGGTLFYRVWVGRYDSLGAARNALESFARAGYGSSFVVALD